MEQLRNSLEVALYCAARDEGKAGHPCRSDDFGGRDKIIFEAGYWAGKAAVRRTCAPAKWSELPPQSKLIEQTGPERSGPAAASHRQSNSSGKLFPVRSAVNSK
jgi:hypothetical protein